MFRAYQVGSRVALLVLAIAFIRTADAQKQSSRSPHGPLAIPCENCHTSTSWAPIRAIPEFNHDSTRYPLRGMHEKVYCTECHFKPVFTDVGKNCADCHADIHRRQFGANCAQCHSVNGWNVSVQAIQNHFNRFPLLGAHAVVQCEECHKGAAVGQYLGLSTACSSCHMADFQKPATIGGGVPNHVTSSSFSGPCEACHTSVDTWQTVTFNHALTGFPLTNGHANVPCESCHVNNNYHLTTTLNECGNSGCHLTTWQQTNNPVHSTAGTQFAAANCAVCHNTVSWTTAIFDHSQTGFTLQGTHMSPSPTPCASCHVNNNYTLSSTDCFGCHQAAFMSTTSMGGNVPNHVTAGFPTTASACATCHPITTWAAGVFDHAATGFALTNGHANVACGACHINNNYTLRTAATDCGNSGCHLTTWNQTNNPVHSTAGAQFAASNCAVCHNTVSWTTATFDHAATGFALTGMHVSPSPTPCISCHVNNNYTLTSTACYGCHVAAWQTTATLGASVPNHITAGYPTTCESCHTTTSWLGAVFNHNVTRFPLTGAHTGVACASCHTSATPPPLDCYSCHTTQWLSTVALSLTQSSVPNHLTAGFVPATCASCHTTSSWQGAVFNHSATRFPLTGAHTTVACNLCHLSSTPPPLDCASCHNAQWQSTATLGGSVPNHLAADAAAAGILQTTCASCHNTTSWLGATFTHSWFNVNHGNAGGVCLTCHLNSLSAGATYTVFQCTGCHGNNVAANFGHPNVNGYVYNSVNCYQCHGRG